MAVNQWITDFCGSGDVFWNASQTWNTPTPELSQCFQETVLVWLPAAFLWLFSPSEVVSIARSKSRLIPWNVYNTTRVIVVSVCILLNLLDLFNCLYRYFTASSSSNNQLEHPYSSEFSAALINIATFGLLLIILLFHRWRGIHTSGVLWHYTLLLLICGAPTFYSYCFVHQQITFRFVTYIVYYIMVIVLFLLCCFADSSAKYKLPADSEQTEEATSQQSCPELEASFLSKLIFWWFNPLAFQGYKKSLVTSDLWSLNEDDKTNTIAPKFDKNWLSQIALTERGRADSQNYVSYKNDEINVQTKVGKTTKNKPGTLLTLIKTFGWVFISGALFKLGHDLLQFTSPLLLKELIAFVSGKKQETPIWHGYIIAVAMFLVATTQSLMLNFYFHRMFMIGMRTRTALISAVYRKSLNLSNSERKTTTIGEIVNLMSVDAQRFVELLPFLNLIWSAPLQIVIALWLLYLELGPSIFAGLAVMVLLLPVNGYLAAVQRKLHVKQMKQKDERVKIMSEILNGIKVIKLYAWEFSFMDKVYKVRNIELNKLIKMAYLGCATTFLWTCAPFLVALVTFAIYVLSDESHILDAQKAFVSLALFNLLRFPMTMLPSMISFLVMTSVSIKRLNKFLNSCELDKYVTRNEEVDSITIENGTFAWESKSTAEKDQTIEVPVTNTLIDINIHIQKGSLIAIVGKVGCGKSSLLSAILGEMDRISGRVNVCKGQSISYCQQQAWIQNATLRNNILFGKRYESKKYNSVIEACALKPDLEILPGGDETEIGEKGINLSGGQKHRVALARACYSDADIYLFDDPLSAVDSHVAKHIFNKVLKNKKGFLKNKTRLLVTNNLSILPDVDSIVVLKDGRISETGTYNQLMESRGAFSEFITEFSKDQKVETNGPLLLREESVISDKLVRSMSIEKSQTDLTKKEQNKLIESEKAETGKVKTEIYARYFKAMTFVWLTSIIVGMIGMQAASVGSNFWLAIWSSDVPINGTQDIDLRNMRLTVYGTFGLAQALLVLLAAFGMAKGSVIASKTLHKSLIERILRSPMSFFDTTPIGRIVNRFSKDIDTVDSTIPHTIRGWILCFLQVVATFMVIGIQTPFFLVVILPLALLYYFIQKFYVATSRQLKRLESITRSPIYSHFSETLSGVNTIRAYDATTRFVSESNQKVDFNQVCYYPSVCANRWLAIRLEFCGNCITLFACLFAVLGRDELSPGIVGLSITYALSVTQTLNWLVRMTSELETNIVSVERIVEYCENPTEAEWFSDKPIPKEWPTQGEIEFSDYSTRYRPGLEVVIKDIKLHISPGEKIGIVGRTGAGKSSLTLSLFRIIEPVTGKIIIDGLDTSQIGLHDLRQKLTIIPQDPVLFSGTLKSNLDPFNKYNDDQIWTVLEHSHLKHFVKSLDKELDHEVSEGGENLSVGQRQLICLARALLRKTKILVLDEATAAVDLETDSLIQTTIRKEFSDCTILTIAHRLNTIMDSNRVLVLDKGEVAEFDSPKVLLSNDKTIFYSLAKDAKLV